MTKHYILFLLVISNTFYGMQKIKNVQDMHQFAGKVVAYRTSSYYFGLLRGYPLNNNKYGYIRPGIRYWYDEDSEKDALGYDLHQLLKPSEVPSSKALIDAKINNGELQMREITEREACLILKAIKKNQAEFEYDTNDKALKIIQKKISSKSIVTNSSYDPDCMQYKLY